MSKESHGEFYPEDILSIQPPIEELSSVQLQAQFNLLNELLSDSIQNKNQTRIQHLEAKIKAITERMHELDLEKAADPNRLIEMLADEEDKKSRFN